MLGNYLKYFPAMREITHIQHKKTFVGGFVSERKNALNGQCQLSIGMFAVWFIIKFVNIVITFPKCIQKMLCSAVGR